MAKAIVDIPWCMQDMCKWHKQGINKLTNIEISILVDAIVNGTQLPDNATNGDMIKAVFPKIDDNFSNVIDLKLWWNAPYKAGDTDEKHQKTV